MRPIDADAALKALRKCQTYLYDARDPELKIELSSAEAAINNLPTIQPEKAQLFSEGTTKGTTKGTTSDLISKTETVEHLRRMLEATVPNTDYDEGFVDGVEFGISTASTMPTIQPQSTTGQLNDGAQSTAQSTNLIERQATIDAVNNAFDRETLLTGLVRSIALRVIRDMPSVQPETKEGKWEQVSAQKYFTSASYFYRCSVCGENNPRNTKYCPNCGADMRGEKDG